MLNEFPIFDYEDIQLIPNKCVVKSRSEVDTHVTLGNHTFNNYIKAKKNEWDDYRSKVHKWELDNYLKQY